MKQEDRLKRKGERVYAVTKNVQRRGRDCHYSSNSEPKDVM